MRTISTSDLEEIIAQNLAESSIHDSSQLLEQLDQQPYLMAYASHPELALKIGPGAETWYPEEIANPNAHLVSAVAALYLLLLQSSKTIPLIIPPMFLEAESHLVPTLTAIATQPDATDDDLMDALVESHHQSALINLGLKLLIMRKEEDLPAPAEDLGDRNSISPLLELREIIKIRVIVDVLDKLIP